MTLVQGMMVKNPVLPGLESRYFAPFTIGVAALLRSLQPRSASAIYITEIRGDL